MKKFKQFVEVMFEMMNLNLKLMNRSINRLQSKIDKQDLIIKYLMSKEEVIEVDEKQYFEYKDSSLFRNSKYIGSVDGRVLLVNKK